MYSESQITTNHFTRTYHDDEDVDKPIKENTAGPKLE